MFDAMVLSEVEEDTVAAEQDDTDQMTNNEKAFLACKLLSGIGVAILDAEQNEEGLLCTLWFLIEHQPAV